MMLLMLIAVYDEFIQGWGDSAHVDMNISIENDVNVDRDDDENKGGNDVHAEVINEGWGDCGYGHLN